MLAAAGDRHIDIDLEGLHLVLRRSTVSRASGVDTSTAALLEHAFGDRDELPSDGYDPRFAEAWSEMRERLERWKRDSGYWGSRQRCPPDTRAYLRHPADPQPTPYIRFIV